MAVNRRLTFIYVTVLPGVIRRQTRGPTTTNLPPSYITQNVYIHPPLLHAENTNIHGYLYEFGPPFVGNGGLIRQFYGAFAPLARGWFMRSYRHFFAIRKARFKMYRNFWCVRVCVEGKKSRSNCICAVCIVAVYRRYFFIGPFYCFLTGKMCI